MSDNRAKEGRYGLCTAAEIPGDVEPKQFPDNDAVFADLKQIVTNGIEAGAKGASLTIKYSDRCSLTWSFEDV